MLKEKLSLEGKGVVITGGGTGLGREMTLAMARAGADLVIASRRVAPIEEVASEVRDLGRKAVAISTDVTDTAQVNGLMESAIAELGKVDVLLNNAGIVRGQGATPIWDISDEDWRLGIDTNMSSAFYCARAIAKHMAERGGGKIINVSSGYGYRGGRDNYMYCVAKGGIVTADADPGHKSGQVRHHEHLYRAGACPHHRYRRVAADAADEQVHPHRQGGTPARAGGHRRVPRVLSLRLHERRGVPHRRRRSGRWLRPDGPRTRDTVENLNPFRHPRLPNRKDEREP